MPGKDKVRITDNWKLYIFSPYQIGKEESLTRQVVTKIVVNTKLNLAREDRNQIRQNALQNAALPKKIWNDSSLLGPLLVAVGQPYAGDEGPTACSRALNSVPESCHRAPASEP